MRATHDELIEKLHEIRELSHDVRFGQLLANLGFQAEDQADRSPWDVEDAELIRIMENHRADLLRRRRPDA